MYVWRTTAQTTGVSTCRVRVASRKLVGVMPPCTSTGSLAPMSEGTRTQIHYGRKYMILMRMYLYTCVFTMYLHVFTMYLPCIYQMYLPCIYMYLPCINMY